MCDVLVSDIRGFSFFNLKSKVNICSGAFSLFYYFFIIIYNVLSSFNLIRVADIQVLISDVQLVLSQAHQNACAEF